MQAARDHEARAAELARWPEMQRDAAGFDDPASGLWYRKIDTSAEEQRAAEYHRSEVSRLQAAYDEACAGVPASEIKTSPFQRYGLGGFSTDDGMILVLSRDAGPSEHLLAAIRCHRAWMMLGEAGMDNCPLDLAGITVEAYGDETGVSVEIKPRDPTLVPELRRRVAKDLEHARTHGNH